MQQATNTTRTVTSRFVRELTGLSYPTISRLAAQGVIPAYRVNGGSYRYNEGEVRQWWNEQRVKPEADK